ncbi:MAG TPA: hypothetical protein VMT19_00540 [Thermoanaerobaculaceae bacterium]|nr:hypothetical protein [Thermoanaerobaculaceae bacterium]
MLTALAVTVGAATWLHISSLPMLAVACGSVVAVHALDTSWKRLLLAAAAASLGIGSALVWIVPTLANLRWLADSAERLGPLGAHVLWRTLTLAPGLRFAGVLVWVSTAGLVALARRNLRLATALGVPAVVWLVLAVFPLPGGRVLVQLQPQRFAVAAVLWMIPCATAAITYLAGRLEPVAAGVALVPVAAFATVFQLLPWINAAAGAVNDEPSLASHSGLPPDVAALVRWIGARPPDRRVLLEDADEVANSAYHGTYAAAMIPLWTGRPLLGGPEGLPFWQQRVDLVDGVWLGHRFTELSGQDLRDRLDRYAVAWIVAVRPDTIHFLNGKPDIVTRAEAWSGFQTFAVREPAGLATGGASVELAYGRIAVRGAREPRTLVRVHWHQTVRTVPALPVEREPSPDDPVGLVVVRNGAVSDFELRFD